MDRGFHGCAPGRCPNARYSWGGLFAQPAFPLPDLFPEGRPGCQGPPMGGPFDLPGGIRRNPFPPGGLHPGMIPIRDPFTGGSPPWNDPSHSAIHLLVALQDFFPVVHFLALNHLPPQDFPPRPFPLRAFPPADNFPRPQGVPPRPFTPGYARTISNDSGSDYQGDMAGPGVNGGGRDGPFPPYRPNLRSAFDDPAGPAMMPGARDARPITERGFNIYGRPLPDPQAAPGPPYDGYGRPMARDPRGW